MKIETSVGSKKASILPAFTKELKKNIPLFIMLLPGIILLVIFRYIPMIGVLIAFKDINYQKGFFDSDWVGLRNFEFLFRTPDAFIITRNTILYNLTFIILGISLAVILAMLFNELRSKLLARTYQTLMFLPYFLSWVVVSYLLYAFLKIDLGFVNKCVLAPLGIKAIDWYSSPQYWPYILVFLHLWKFAGYSSVVYLASIIGIDQEYYEAAQIDGATKLQQAMHITIPCISPVIVIFFILDIGKIFHADFGLFFQTTLDSGALFPVTDVIDTYVYRSLRVTGDLGMSASAGFYQAVVGFALVLITNSIVKKLDSEKSLF